MPKIIFEEDIYGYHIDFVGHVNNANYILWLENGRSKLLEQSGIPTHQIADETGIVPAITETHIKYKKPFFLHNKVTVELWIAEINNASAILKFRLLNEKGELCSEAWQKGLFIDRLTMRPRRLPQEIREAFSKFLIPDKD